MTPLGELSTATVLIGSGSIALLCFSIELWGAAKDKCDAISRFADRFIAVSAIGISIFFIGALVLAWLIYLGVV